jgi:hypothetical protein
MNKEFPKELIQELSTCISGKLHSLENPIVLSCQRINIKLSGSKFQINTKFTKAIHSFQAKQSQEGFK